MYHKPNLITLLVIACCQYLFCEGVPLEGNSVQIAKVENFPFLVSIGNLNPQRTEEENHFCGGTLITHKHVLTAGHCMVENHRLWQIVVKVGSNDLKKADNHTVRSWTSYNQWARNNNKTIVLPDNDISIIELGKKVDSKIEPAVIVDAKADDEQATTAGWGGTLHVSAPRLLHFAVLSILNRNECRSAMRKSGLFEDSEITSPVYLCTGYKPRVVLGCGDSGSPLIIGNNKIIAINKSVCPTFFVTHRKFYSVTLNAHIRVDYYKDFIESFTKGTK